MHTDAQVKGGKESRNQNARDLSYYYGAMKTRLADIQLLINSGPHVLGSALGDGAALCPTAAAACESRPI